MKIVYQLDSFELEQVQFSCQFICDRQYNGVSMEDMLKHQFIRICSRMDMYWINCTLGTVDCGPMCVEPQVRNIDKFYIVQNHCQIQPFCDIVKRATDWFQQQPQYTLQCRYMELIHDKWFKPHGGYDKFIVASRIAADTYRKQKIDLCIQYRTLIEEYKKYKTMCTRSKLDKAFAHVYYNGPYLSLGLEHMLWIYDNYAQP